MPANRRRRRTTPGDETLPPIYEETLPEDSAEGDGEDPRLKLPFFEHLRMMNEQEQQDFMVYVYRQDPPVENSENNRKYAAKYPPTIDEETIKREHGGGKYLCYLNDMSKKPNVLIRKHTFWLTGAPIIPEGTVLIDGKNGRQIAQPAQASGGTAESLVAEVVKSLTPLIHSKPNVSQEEMLSTAMGTMRRAMEQSIDIMGSSIKKQADSVSGNPLMDGLIAKALERLLNPAPQQDPMTAFKTMLETMREMQGLTGGGTRRTSGLVDELKGVAELLKVDEDGTIKNLIFGRNDRDEQPASISSSLLRIGEAILTRRPDIIDSGAALLARVASGPQTPAPQTQPQHPTLSGAGPTPVAHAGTQQQPTAVPSSSPAAAEGSQSAQIAPSPEEQMQQQMVAGILQAIVNGYNSQNTGDAVAISLQMLFPNQVSAFAGYLSMPDGMVFSWLRSQPLIAPIVDQEDFAEFYADFKRQMLLPYPGLDEAQGEAEGE
jgi:hypothetical protein